MNPPIDLAACVRAIERRRNAVYQRHYVRGLCRLLARIARVRTVPGPVPRAREIRTVRRFDDRYTAPDAGYSGADAYYADASAGPRLDGLRRPALVVSAADDPFVPLSMFAAHRGRPGLELVHPRRGGHCGYWQAGPVRYWAGQVMLEFFASHG